MTAVLLFSLALSPRACTRDEQGTTPTPPPAPVPECAEAPRGTETPAPPLSGPGTPEPIGDQAFRAASRVDAATFAPDGSWLLTREYDDARLQRWSVPDGALIDELPSPCEGTSTRWGIDVSPDGRRLAIPCDGENLTIAVLETGAVVHVVDGDANAARWSADGRSIGATYDDGARLIDAETGTILRHWPGTTDTRIVPVGEGWAVLAPAPGADLETWWEDVPHHLEVVDSRGERRWLREQVDEGPLAASADGRHLYLTTDDGDAVLQLDATTGDQAGTRSVDWVEQLAPAADGVWVASSGQLMHLDAELRTRSFVRQPTAPMVSSRDGRLLAVLGGARPALLDATGQALHRTDTLGAAADATAVSADGSVVAAVSVEGRVQLVDRRTGATRVLDVGDWADLPALTPDGRTLAIYTDAPQLIDVETGQQRPVQGATWASVSWQRFVADGRQLLALAEDVDDVHLMVVDVETGIVRSQTPLGPGLASAATLSDDERTLVLPMTDGRLQVVPLR